jgi:UDP-2,3-diacylglucosamine hydrolase
MTSVAEPSSTQGRMRALFVSDVHLQESMPATTAAFLRFLHQQATQADALYILGDLFEYWAGDDDIDAPLHRQIIEALRALHDKGTALFWIGGNRDFLIGSGFAEASGCGLLNDGSVVQIAGKNFVLAHGDAQCTDDVDYIAFRKQVRQTDWQQRFLTQPLEQRKTIISGMRAQSRTAQRYKAAQIMDVNPDAIDHLFDESGANVMIHGHTHRPALHVTGTGKNQRIRVVLPDWDWDEDNHDTLLSLSPIRSDVTPRGGWVGIDDSGNLSRFDCVGNLLA